MFHAIGWGAPRLAILIGAIVFLTVMAYSTLVFGIVVVQAVASFNT